MIETKTLDNEFDYLDIENKWAHVKVSLQGAHVFHYKPKKKKEVLWLSQESFFIKGKAIRGGIPICWPWFGKHTESIKAPQHGFARTSQWKLIHINDTSLETTVTLQLTHTQQTLSLWPYKFKLSLTIVINEKLTLSLSTYNDDIQSFTITEALHSYFLVKDINHTHIYGLENIKYIDQTNKNSINTSASPISIDKETDRIYTQTKDSCVLQEEERVVSIKTKGSSSTVVWNPWIEKAKIMQDFHHDGYKEMVCIEAANTVSNSVTIAPQQTHTLVQIIEVKEEI